jgi:hypothetical protein
LHTKKIIGLVLLLTISGAIGFLGMLYLYTPSTTGFDYHEPAYDAASLPHIGVGQSLDFGKGLNRSALLSGWSGSETEGVWSDGNASYLGFIVESGPDQGSGVPQSLVLNGKPFLVEEKLTDQRLEVWSRGIKIAKYVLKDSNAEIIVPLNALTLTAGAPLILGLSLPDAKSPKELNLGDPRRLGIFLQSIQAQ